MDPPRRLTDSESETELARRVSPCRAGLVLLGILVAPAAIAAEPVEDSALDPKFAVAAGIGHAYAFTGARAELRMDQFAGFIGVGTLAGLLPMVAGGVRWSSRPGAGWAVSFHASATGAPRNTDPIRGSFLLITGALTGGYRWRWEHWFVDGAIGPAFALHRFETEDNRVFTTNYEYGPGAYGPRTSGPLWLAIPDLALAVGYEF